MWQASWLHPPAPPVAGQPFLRFDTDEFLTHFTHSLDCLLSTVDPISGELQKVKLEELLLYLAVPYPEQFQFLRPLGDTASDELLVRQAVTSHIGSSISVEELAFLCNMSLSTFKRRFAHL